MKVEYERQDEYRVEKVIDEVCGVEKK